MVALFGDFGVKAITKDHAIDELLKYLGADIQDTFAFSDAVASDRNEIKAMADYVTDTADDEIHIASKHFGII